MTMTKATKLSDVQFDEFGPHPIEERVASEVRMLAQMAPDVVEGDVEAEEVEGHWRALFEAHAIAKSLPARWLYVSACKRAFASDLASVLLCPLTFFGPVWVLLFGCGAMLANGWMAWRSYRSYRAAKESLASVEKLVRTFGSSR